MKIITATSRIIVGLLFIFSGFIKANDPIGFSYKLVEYYGVFGTTFLNSTAVAQAIFICVLEIVLGICVLIGIRMKITSWLLLLLIIFFTFLTGYTAISNWFYEHPDHPRTEWFEGVFGFDASRLYYMKDCGCFGDAIKLTPWQSFYKDLILLVLIVVIFLRRKKILPFFARIMQTNILIFFILASTAFSVYCYYYLPAVNFLKWKNGADIRPMMEGKAPVIESVFIYKKDGVEHRFKLEEFPPDISEYTFVDRVDSVIVPEVKAEIHDFYMTGMDGNTYHQEVLEKDNYKLLVVAYDLDKSRDRAWKKLAATAAAWQAKGYDIYGITGEDLENAEKFRHEKQLPFPFYFMDPTSAKGMIRSNPGIILMKKSVIIDQYPAPAVPSIEKLEKRIAKFEKKQP